MGDCLQTIQSSVSAISSETVSFSRLQHMYNSCGMCIVSRVWYISLSIRRSAVNKSTLLKKGGEIVRPPEAYLQSMKEVDKNGVSWWRACGDFNSERS